MVVVVVVVVGGGNYRHHQKDYALRWAAVRATQVNISFIVRGKVTDGVHKPQLLKRQESRSGESNRRRPLTGLTLYR